MPTTNAHRLMLFGALGLALSGTGCASTEMIPTRYGAPLAGDHAQDLETNRCARACYEEADQDSSHFYACLSTCPGVVTLAAATCEDPAETPEAFCYTQWVEREAESGSDSASNNFWGELVGAVLNGLIESAFRSGKPEHARREREEASPRGNQHRSERPSRSRSSHEPRRYVPARPRRR